MICTIILYYRIVITFPALYVSSTNEAAKSAAAVFSRSSESRIEFKNPVSTTPLRVVKHNDRSFAVKYSYLFAAEASSAQLPLAEITLDKSTLSTASILTSSTLGKNV